jgi:hypothetical protein
VDKALKRQLIGAVEPIYLRAVMHPDTGYAMTTTRQLLDHLFRFYGLIKPHELEENDKKFKQAYDPNQPFETFVQQINEALGYAAAGGSPYSDSQTVTNAYNLLFQTGMFPDACREWRRRLADEQTWTNFQTDFALAHDDWKSSRNTSQQQGYQAANHLVETFAKESADAFTHLAYAAQSDREIVRTLTSANEALTKMLATQELEITKLRQMFDSFKNKNKPPGDGKRRYPPNGNYCWTHGFDINKTHKSDNCLFPKEGHQKEATATNTMGGSMANKGKK